MFKICLCGGSDRHGHTEDCPWPQYDIYDDEQVKAWEAARGRLSQGRRTMKIKVTRTKMSHDEWQRRIDAKIRRQFKMPKKTYGPILDPNSDSEDYSKFLPVKEQINRNRAKANGFACRECKRKPPEIMWMWEWSGKYCNKCYMRRLWIAILSFLIILLPLLFGLTDFLINTIGLFGFILGAGITIGIMWLWFNLVTS